MKPFINPALLGLLALSAAAHAQALQSIDPEASVPAVTYRSAFENYTPWREPKLAPWLGVNNQVREVGGHHGIFRSGPHDHGGMAKPPSKPAANPMPLSESPAVQSPARMVPNPPAQGHGGH